MQSYDVIMLTVLGGATLLGAMRGMAWQVASLASVIVSSIVAVRYADLLAPHISGSESTSRLLAMLILYLLTSLAIWTAFRLAASAIDRVRLQGFDRQIGALFGASKGVLWCLLITFFAVTMSNDTRALVLASRSGHYMAELVHTADPLLPEQIHELIGEYIEQLDRGLDPTIDPVAEPDEPSPRRAAI
jgi:membrane protein required for colicin V production